MHCLIISADYFDSGSVMKKPIFLFLAVVFINSSFLISQKKIEIGIDEQLGEQLPLELSFYDESGEKRELGDLITVPTVLAFVYYECPGICSPLMTSIAEVVNRVDLKPGENYNIITLSMDEYEKPYLAANKKQNYMKLIEEDFPQSSWKFLTGDSASIKTLTDAAGFYFKREGKDFIHSGALIFISKEAKICRYLFPNYSDSRGYSILPFDFKMALTEASDGRPTPTIARMLQFCFRYDPDGKTYVLNITRIFGAGILFVAVLFVLYLTVKPKKVRTDKTKGEERKQEEINDN
jgi:protein SCO1/2